MIHRTKVATRFPMPSIGSTGRTRVKLCGLTQPHDIRVAVRQGADAIGLVCVPGSKRELSIEQAVRLRVLIPPFVAAVLLLADAEEREAAEAIESIKPNFVQFHGSEEPDYCASFGVPFFKGISAKNQDEVSVAAQRYRMASALLLDSHEPGAMGGTGIRFDWTKVPQGLELPIILAGGLCSENVREAINAVHPYAVDVSSGIESSPGRKDARKIHAFVEAVRFVDTVRGRENSENA